MLDEAMGAAVWLKGIPAVAKELRFRYLGMAPTRTRISVEAKVTAVRGENVHVRCRLYLGKEIFVEGVGVFHRLSSAQLRRIALKAGLAPDRIDFGPAARTK